MAIILHLDFNSYFASVEQQANPFLRGLPIAVAGKGRHSIDVAMAHRGSKRITIDQLSFQRSVVTTASREAKKRGVKTAMGTWEARKICPEMLVIPGDPKKYGEITSRFMTILKRYADSVQQFSTDEAFADITCASGGDYFGATILAQQIRADIKNECGEYCTVSIGIAANKFLAKLASESKKPNGLTCVPPHEAEDFVLTRPLADFCGIGRRIEKHLERLGATSVATLRRLPLSLLLSEFKSYGYFLYNSARGLGPNELESIDDPKSIGNSYTFPHDLKTDHEIYQNLLALADRVAWRMRKQKFIATHISGYVRYGDFGGYGFHRRCKDPLIDGLEITNTAWEIMKEKIDIPQGVRLIGVSASGLLPIGGSDSLFEKERRKARALQALDKVTDKYGSGAWQRASTMKTSFKERVSGWHYDHES
ncbi:MAG TPA: DNA polymerase IV [bacterium]|nr:DNA polymerase IV [bacterium]